MSEAVSIVPGGTQVRVFSWLRAKASWEIYCSGDEGRRREERKEVKWRRGEKILWEEGKEGEVKERRRKGGGVRKTAGLVTSCDLLAREGAQGRKCRYGDRAALTGDTVAILCTLV